jgi:hypothetical protein
MNRYRTVALFALMAIGFGTIAIAADVEFESSDHAPIRFHRVHPLVVIQQVTKQIRIGAGTTPIDHLRTVDCRSVTGCVITAKALAEVSSVECPSLSAYVDGVAMQPLGESCAPQVVVQESAMVTPGQHTIQSEITEPQDGSGSVLSFEAEYTVYDRRPRAN